MIGIGACLNAVGRLTLLKYFPTDPAAHAGLAELLHGMVSNESQLDWLVQTLINHVGEWPGPKEVRGLFCSQFQPADGIETHTSIAGFSPADCEARNLEKSERFKQLEKASPRTCELRRIGA